jgi:hypothetical protein
MDWQWLTGAVCSRPATGVADHRCCSWDAEGKAPTSCEGETVVGVDEVIINTVTSFAGGKGGSNPTFTEAIGKPSKKEATSPRDSVSDMLSQIRMRSVLGEIPAPANN